MREGAPARPCPTGMAPASPQRGETAPKRAQLRGQQLRGPWEGHRDSLGTGGGQPGFRVSLPGQSPFTYSLRTLLDSTIVFSKLRGEQSRG